MIALIAILTGLLLLPSRGCAKPPHARSAKTTSGSSDRADTITSAQPTTSSRLLAQRGASYQYGGWGHFTLLPLNDGGQNFPLNSGHGGGVNIAMADGSIRFFMNSLSLNAISYFWTKTGGVK